MFPITRSQLDLKLGAHIQLHVCELISLTCKSLRAGLLRCVHVCSAYRSNRDCATREAVILYKILKSCDRKTLFDWLTANRCRGLYENVCGMGSTPRFHVAWPCRDHLTNIIFFYFGNRVCEPCRRHKMRRNEGAHIGFSSQTWSRRDFRMCAPSLNANSRYPLHVHTIKTLP
jgi:hypothetical protein